jgi:hemin uptake protein HemP
MDVSIRAPGILSARRAVASQTVFESDGDIFIDRAGVRLLFLHAQFGQQVENDSRLHLELPGQLVDSDFLHRRNC